MQKERKKYIPEKPLSEEKIKYRSDEYLPVFTEDYDDEVLSSLDTFPTKAALGLYLRHIKYEDI